MLLMQFDSYFCLLASPLFQERSNLRSKKLQTDLAARRPALKGFLISENSNLIRPNHSRTDQIDDDDEDDDESKIPLVCKIARFVVFR